MNAVMITGCYVFSMLIAAACHAADEDAVFAAGSAWETVSGNHRIVEGIAATADGTVYLTDVPDRELIKLAPGAEEVVMDAATGAANGLALGPGRRLFGACMHEPAIVFWHLDDGKRESIPLPTPANDLVIGKGGHVYYTWGRENAVYHFDLADPRPAKAADLPNPNGITLSHDQRELWVGAFFSDTVFAFPVLEDGALGPSKPAFKAKVPEDGRGLLDGMTPLRDGRLLVTTALGLQILSRTAEPVLISNPTRHRANYVRIVTDAGGTRWIYAAHEKSVLRRKTLL